MFCGAIHYARRVTLKSTSEPRGSALRVLWTTGLLKKFFSKPCLHRKFPTNNGTGNGDSKLKTLPVSLALAVLVSSLGCGPQHREPDFVIGSDNGDNRAIAIFLDQDTLKKHRVDVKDFEETYLSVSNGIAEAVVSEAAKMIADMLVDDEGDSPPAQQPVEKDPFVKVSKDAFVELMSTMRMEEWEYQADGTHKTVKNIPAKPWSFTGPSTTE